MTDITEMVYPGSGNTVVLKVKIDGVSNPLGGVTRMTAKLHPSGELVDSDVDASLLSWTWDEPNSQSLVTLKLGSLNVAGRQKVELIAFDPVYTQRTVVHPRNFGNTVTLEFP